MRRLLALLPMISLFGCGTTAQFIFGWTSTESVRKSETRTVAVTTQPAGATVFRRDGSGNEVQLGTAPFTDSHQVEMEQVTESPNTAWMWIGGVTELVLAGVLVSVSDTADDATFNAGGLAGIAGITDLVVGLVHAVGGSEIKRKPVGGSLVYEYRASYAGLPDQSARVSVPDQSMVSLVLDPKLAAQSPRPPVPPSTPPAQQQPSKPSGGAGTGVTADASWVIAVMEVEDTNAENRDKAIERGLVRNLGDQLRVFIAQRGVRTVDRGSQDRALKEQIEAAKKDSYKSCYDDSCQVELGKALAASHILRSRITRFGKRCVLNTELIDLKQEVTMAAASSQGDCQAEGFLTMGEEVAQNLIKR